MSADRERGSFDIYPIPKVDVYQAVIEQLEALVGAMEPGERLPSERALVDRLQVSRVSIREALRTLVSLGKIEFRRNASLFASEETISRDLTI